MLAVPAEATWNQSFFGSQYRDSPERDFLRTPSATSDISFSIPTAQRSSEGMVRDVQDWLDRPDQNFDWILIDPLRQKTARRFYSRQEPDVENRPKLMVMFTPVPMDPFEGVEVSGGFLFSAWYGYYNPTFFPWAFHPEHDWQYIFPTETSGEIFTYDLESADFWWTSSVFQPFTF